MAGGCDDAAPLLGGGSHRDSSRAKRVILRLRDLAQAVNGVGMRLLAAFRRSMAEGVVEAKMLHGMVPRCPGGIGGQQLGWAATSRNLESREFAWNSVKQFYCRKYC